MKGKRIVTFFILGLFLITILLSGCKSASKQANATKNNAKSESSKEIKTFTLYVGDSNMKPIDLSATPVGQKVTELTGVKLKTSYIVGSDEKTKANLMITGGDLPDLIDPHNEYQTFRDAGVLVPLDDYIQKYGKNIKKWYSPQDLNKMRDPKDGHIYYLTPFRKSTTLLYQNSGFYLPMAVLKEAGWPRKLTLDQYFNIIENYVKKHPTYNGQPTIGFTADTDNWRIYVLINVPSYLAGNPNTGGVWVDDNYNAHSFALTQWAHDYFKKLNEEWNKGIVDKQMFTRNYDSYKSLIASGRLIGFYDERWQIQDAINALEQQKMYDRVPFALPVTFPGVTKEAYNGINITGTGAGVCITKSCKDPVAAFKFLDAMASEEVLKLVNWGIEGKDYTVKDGKMYMTPEQLARFKDANYTQKEGIGSFWIFPHPDGGAKFSDGNYVFPQDTPEYISSAYKPYEKEVLNAYHLKNLADLMAPPLDTPYGYVWDITIPDSEQEIKIAQQKASDLTRKYVAKLIMAKPGEYESIWKEYVAEMKKAKYDIGDAYITQQIKKRVQEWGSK